MKIGTKVEWKPHHMRGVHLICRIVEGPFPIEGHVWMKVIEDKSNPPYPVANPCHINPEELRILMG